MRYPEIFCKYKSWYLEKYFKKYIADENVLRLLAQIIDSFGNNIGLPLGNLTSQLMVNIYMNEFDQFVKRNLKVKYYIRYADDFVIISDDKKYLEKLVGDISKFLESNLSLSLHSDKLFIKTLNSGLDFLGWVNFLRHRVLRTSTKRRILRRLEKNAKPEVLDSYLGILSHGNSHDLADLVRYLNVFDELE